MEHVIAYGRTGPHSEPVGRRYQRSCIRSQVGTGTPIHMEFDDAPGDAPFSDRPALQFQILQAQATKQPLCVEAMDRILASFDHDKVAGFKKEIDRFGVPVAVAHLNLPTLRRIRRILGSSKTCQQKRRYLVRLVDNYLRWRFSTIYSAGKAENGDSGLAPFGDLKATTLFPVLATCADHLLRLNVDGAIFPWHLHGCLGAAWEHRTRVLLEQRNIPGGQLGYGERENDLEMFQGISRLEQQQLTTWDGRPMAVSNQRIADELNEMGYRNLRGSLFSRKTVFQVRRSAVYLGSVLKDSTTLANLSSSS